MAHQYRMGKESPNSKGGPRLKHWHRQSKGKSGKEEEGDWRQPNPPPRETTTTTCRGEHEWWRQTHRVETTSQTLFGTFEGHLIAENVRRHTAPMCHLQSRKTVQWCLLLQYNNGFVASGTLSPRLINQSYRYIEITPQGFVK